MVGTEDFEEVRMKELKIVEENGRVVATQDGCEDCGCECCETQSCECC